MSRMLEALKRIDALATVAPPAEPIEVRGPESIEADIERLESAIEADRAGEGRGDDDSAIDNSPTIDNSRSRQAADLCEETAASSQHAECATGVSPVPAEAPHPSPLPEGEGTADQPACDPAYVKLADALLAELPSDAGATLMLTTPSDDSLCGEVATPIVRALASRIDGSILVIDANLRRPILADRLGVEPAAGLTDVLNGAAGWDETIRRTIVPGVDLLPGKRFATPAGRPPLRLNLQGLFSEVGDRYRLIVVHAASLASDAVAPMSRSMSGVCLLLRQGETLRRHATEAAALIERNGGRTLGCVLVE